MKRLRSERIRVIEPDNKLKSLPLDFSMAPEVYDVENWHFSEMEEVIYEGQEVYRLEARCTLDGYEKLILEWFATELDLKYINGDPDAWRRYAITSFGESLIEKRNHYLNKIGEGLKRAVKAQQFFMNNANNKKT